MEVAVCLVWAFACGNSMVMMQMFLFKLITSLGQIFFFSPVSFSHPVSCSIICFCVLTRISLVISR